ncbi:SdiA-regulated domain-containing protein [Niabella sp. CC-SYL272]|uniref:SdiA-regulated domain-containing protein n=1 Tax=Niabella agricola TaxID=2891571 RepID=UPI001F1B649F|nr:SdiA-regulated domain-containing protein [Niabella agricola]MCF3110548.1 SdiA-regulated domain-containing protein [Niabella agricola]
MNKFGMLLFSLATASCMGQKEYTSPAGYDLSRPETFNMPVILDEISGITFAGGDSLYAVQDESGTVFHFKPGSKELAATKFGKKGDYEDLAVSNGHMVILRSDGSLFAFPVNETALNEAVSVQEWKKLVPEGEYEALYADPVSGDLYVLCKQCKADKKTSQVTGYLLQWSGSELAVKSAFTLDAATLQENKSKKNTLKPSALARNPKTGEWYVLSSVNKMLLVADPQWKVIGMHALKPSLYAQPEGIAFDKAGNLWISNEKNQAAYGAVLKFARKQ